MQRSLKSRSKRGTSSQNSTTKEVGNIYQKNLDQLLNYRSEYTAWSPVPRYKYYHLFDLEVVLLAHQ